MAPETGNVGTPANGGEAPFRLSRDTQGNAILILGESRHNLGRWEEAAVVLAEALKQHKRAR